MPTNTVAVFTAVSGGFNYNLWVTDGTAGGTTQVTPTNGFGSLAANSYAVLGTRAYFAGAGIGGKFSLLSYDPRSGVITDLAPANAAPGGVSPSSITAYNGKLYFAGTNAAGAHTLWTSDGTAAGTTELFTNGGYLYPGNFTPFNGKLYFSGASSSFDSGLFATDGTVAGTARVPLGDGGIGGYNIRSHGIAALGGRLLFEGNSGNAQVLYVSDGTAANTAPLNVPELAKVSFASSVPTGLLRFGNKVAFTALDTAGRNGIWVTDGTATNTIELPGIVANTYGNPMVALPNGQLVFIANDMAGKGGVYVSDGTAAGTRLLQVPGAAASGLAPGQLLNIGNEILFDGLTAVGTRGLFRTDGTQAGTSVIKTGFNLFYGDVDSDFALVPGQIQSTIQPSAIATTGKATPIFTVTPPGPFDPLVISSFTDPAFPTGSTVTLDAQGRGFYQPGTVTGAKAGLDPVQITVTDTATGVQQRILVPVTLQVATDPLFDEAYYLAQNPDVKAAGVDPLQHYLSSGYKEGRDPNAYFSTSLYLKNNPDVAAGGLNPLLQFEAGGYAEGRNPSATFSLGDYLAANPDVKAAGLNPLLHFLKYGRAEGRSAFPVGSTPGPLFDAAFYYARNPDVRAAGADAYAHYLSNGYREGRAPDAYFDAKYYLTQNPDVKAAGIDPLAHFVASGYKEGREPSLVFSDAKYLAANPDVKAAGLNPLAHYVTYGLTEGRMAFLAGGTLPADPLVNASFYDAQLGATLLPTGLAAQTQAAASYDAIGWKQGLNPDAFFDTAYYLARNPDVAAAKINPLTHYETFGYREGRDPSAAFSTNKYLAAYADVKSAGLNPLQHYLSSGQADGRTAFTV